MVFMRILFFLVILITTPLLFASEIEELNARIYANLYQWPEKQSEFPESNPYSEKKVELGKTLFMEKKLSGDGKISCASCHNPNLYWQDGKAKAVGHNGEVLARRTPTILNLGYSQGVFFWDGRAESLEQQALMPITNPHEMQGMDMVTVKQKIYSIKKYPPMFKEAFPENGELITDEKIGKAIATFERTIISKKSSFDNWVLGDARAISSSAKKGFILFNSKAGCSNCHTGFRFTDDSFHDIGLNTKDRGRGALSDFKDIESMQYAFKTPTLREVFERAPYMHDGLTRNLKDAIEFYNKGGEVKRASLANEMKPLNLNDDEKKDLLEFLKTLSSSKK